MSSHLTLPNLSDRAILRTRPRWPDASGESRHRIGTVLWALAALASVLLMGCQTAPAPPREPFVPLAADLYRAIGVWRQAVPNAPPVAVAVAGPVDPPRVANSPGISATDDAIPVASVTKVLVAMAALRLEEEGHWSLDDAAASWLDGELAAPPFETPPATLRDLVSHTSGIRDPAAGRAFANGILRPTTPPRLSFSYSNEGYGLLARAIARADGRSWVDAISERPIVRMELPSAHFEQSTTMPPGSVGLVCSASDLACIGQLFIDPHATVVSPSMRRAFLSPALDDGSRPDRLLCAQAIRARGGRLDGWMHAGRSGSSGAELIVLARHGIVIAIASDAAYDATEFDSLRPLLIEAAVPGLQLATAPPKPPRLRWPKRLVLESADGARLSLARSDADPGALVATLPDARDALLWPVDGTRATARLWVEADSRASLELQAPLARATGQQFELLARGRTIRGVLWQGTWFAAK